MADDLTGALDSAARFVPLVGPVPVFWRGEPSPGTAAFDAGTREMGCDAAASTVTALLPFLSGADIAFKKIDSLMRGHVAGELAACRAAFDHVVLAPAFPFQGRITRGSRQLTLSPEGWRDVGFDFAGLGVQDAETEADLDRIVGKGRLLQGRILWCGTGGLAGALAGRRRVPRPALSRPVLALVGSHHPVSARQVSAAAEWHHLLPRPLPALNSRGHVVSVSVPAGTPRTQARAVIIEAFAGLLGGVQRPGTLFVSGGETLRGLCGVLQVDRLVVDGELEPGVPTSVMRGGKWDGQRVVSKSGAFGDTQFLAALLRCVDSRQD